MRKNSVVKNYIYNVLYQILVMILPLITTPYLSRVLGAENIGIYSYTMSITTYFILFGSLGIAMYAKREIAYFQDDIKKRSSIFFEILLIRCITLGLSLLIFYFTFCINGQYNIYYKVLILEIIANCLDISWYFQGLEEFKKTVTRNIIVKIISIICIFAFIKTPNDLTKYFAIYVISNLLGNLSLWLYLPKYINKIKFKTLNLKKHIKPVIFLFIPQIATQIYTVLDKTMIGVIINNKSEVGYYEQSQKIVKLCLMLATSLGAVMVPRISNIYANKDEKKLKYYMNLSFGFTLMLTFPLMFGLISISDKFVPIFFGQGYDKVSVLLKIISPIIVAIGLSTVIGTQYLISTKQQKKFTISVVCGALINFFLNLMLIKGYASIGASIATVIAEISVTTIQFILVRKQIKLLDVLKLSYKYIIASIIMFIVSILTGLFITNSLLSIIIQIIVSSICYLLILFVLKDKLLYIAIQKIIKKFNS